MADPGKRIPPSAEAPAILECNGVRKTFGGITAIEDISLTLRDGEILGLIGHNGAGKTTFFDCVSGFLPLDGGRIRLGGADIGAWPAHLRAAAGLGRTFQEARLFPSLTVAETIAVAQERHLALTRHGGGRAAAARLARLRGRRGREGRPAGRDDGPRRVPREAGGRAVDRHPAHRGAGLRAGPGPGVLLLDEPSGGVAQRETEAMGPLLIRVQQHTGCSILVVEHDMPLLTAICDRMIALELGEVIAEGTPAEVLEHPAVIESLPGHGRGDHQPLRRPRLSLGRRGTGVTVVGRGATSCGAGRRRESCRGRPSPGTVTPASPPCARSSPATSPSGERSAPPSASWWTA